MTLYIIPTPIGNIKDITLRALEVFKENEIFLCEDTRVTKKLLDLLNIDSADKKFIPYFEHNERKKISEVVDLLKSGRDLILVSDAGTPLVSDPGFPLIRKLRELNDSEIKIVVLPGATSVTTALVSSGFPTDKFTFLGYIPRKPADRRKIFKSVIKSHMHIKSSYIMFESAVRIKSTLTVVKEIFKKNVEVCVCRELTKKFEELSFYKIESLDVNKYKEPKGELVVLLRFID